MPLNRLYTSYLLLDCSRNKGKSWGWKRSAIRHTGIWLLIIWTKIKACWSHRITAGGCNRLMFTPNSDFWRRMGDLAQLSIQVTIHSRNGWNIKDSNFRAIKKSLCSVVIFEASSGDMTPRYRVYYLCGSVPYRLNLGKSSEGDPANAPNPIFSSCVQRINTALC